MSTRNLSRPFFSVKDRARPGANANRRRRPALESLEGRALLSIGIGEVTLPDNFQPNSIAKGSDGNLWFTSSPFFDVHGAVIGKVTPTGQVTEYPIPGTGGSANYQANPIQIVAGPDGNLWFTDQHGAIGEITLDGQITECALPTAGAQPIAIATGSDGNVWFTETANKIGRITPQGQITEFSLPGGTSSYYEFGTQGLALGSDGNLWFTEYYANKIGRITPQGQITEFTIPTIGGENAGLAAGGARPEGITARPDGSLWFTEQQLPDLGRITTDGTITQHPIGTSVVDGTSPSLSIPTGPIITGPDGDLWVAETDGASRALARLTPTGAADQDPLAVIAFQIPTVYTDVSGISVGPDGNLWFSGSDENLGRIGQVILNANDTPPTVTAGPINLLENQSTDVVAQFTPSTPGTTAADYQAYVSVDNNGPGRQFPIPVNVVSDGHGGFLVTYETSFYTEGDYPLTVTVFDTRLNQGGAVAQASTTIVVHEAPVPGQGTSATATAGAGAGAPSNIVVATGSLSSQQLDSGGSLFPMVATIDWGDGTPVTAGSLQYQYGILILPDFVVFSPPSEPAPPIQGYQVAGTHAYAAPGTYTVHVTVMENGEPDSAVTFTTTVVVGPASSAPTPPAPTPLPGPVPPGFNPGGPIQLPPAGPTELSPGGVDPTTFWPAQHHGVAHPRRPAGHLSHPALHHAASRTIVSHDNLRHLASGPGHRLNPARS